MKWGKFQLRRKQMTIWEADKGVVAKIRDMFQKNHLTQDKSQQSFLFLQCLQSSLSLVQIYIPVLHQRDDLKDIPIIRSTQRKSEMWHMFRMDFRKFLPELHFTGLNGFLRQGKVTASSLNLSYNLLLFLFISHVMK